MKFDRLTKTLINYSRKEIDEEIKNLGFFAIITSKEMNGKKIFRMDKWFLGFDIFRFHTDEALTGKMFVSFIAIILKNGIMSKLNELRLKDKIRYSLSFSIKELEKLALT